MQKPMAVSQSHYRQQRFWQIIFPVVLVSVALLAGLVYLLLPGTGISGDVAGLAEVSTVILVLPTLVLLLPMLALMVGLVVLLSKLMGWLPSASGQAFTFMEMVNSTVRKSTSALTAPVLFVRQMQAQIQQLAHSLVPNHKLGKEL